MILGGFERPNHIWRQDDEDGPADSEDPKALN
jgi:hypothetical protein